MDQITTIGLDIAKSVFRVPGIAADGAVVVRRQLRRAAEGKQTEYNIHTCPKSPIVAEAVEKVRTLRILETMIQNLGQR